jgi:hypothetical protein
MESLSEKKPIRTFRIKVNGESSSVAFEGDNLTIHGYGPLSEWGDDILIDVDGVTTINVNSTQLQANTPIVCPAFNFHVVARTANQVGKSVVADDTVIQDMANTAIEDMAGVIIRKL